MFLLNKTQTDGVDVMKGNFWNFTRTFYRMIWIGCQCITVAVFLQLAQKKWKRDQDRKARIALPFLLDLSDSYVPLPFACFIQICIIHIRSNKSFIERSTLFRFVQEVSLDLRFWNLAKSKQEIAHRMMRTRPRPNPVAQPAKMTVLRFRCSRRFTKSIFDFLNFKCRNVVLEDWWFDSRQEAICIKRCKCWD